MSIINEALKKAQREPAGASPAAVSDIRLKTQFKEELLGKKRRINWGPAFILAVLSLIVGPILLPLFSTPFKVATAPSPSPVPELASVGAVMPQAPRMEAPLRSPAMSPQFAIEEAPATPTLFRPLSPKPNYTLSGIVFSEKESYCLVNGKVLKVGESMGNASVVKITPEQVTLETNGGTVVLTTAAY